MEPENQELTPPESTPSEDKPKNTESNSGDVITVSQNTLYYFLTGVLFFVAGFGVAWVTFASRADDIKSPASGTTHKAFQTAIAGLVTGQNTAPTPTPIPRQDIRFDADSPSWGPADAK